MQPVNRKLYLKVSMLQRIKLFFLNFVAIFSLFIRTLFDYTGAHNPNNNSQNNQGN